MKKSILKRMMGRSAIGTALLALCVVVSLCAVGAAAETTSAGRQLRGKRELEL